MRSSKTIQLHSRDCRRNRVSAAGPRHLAFTLVEVLVVIAITVILFGLLIRPVIDTLRYTKDAQLQAAAQDSARKTMEILSREIGSAAYVSDNASHAFDGSSVSTYAGVQSAQFSNFLNVAIPTSDPTTSTFAHIYNAKLDVIMARHVDSKNG
jgi:Tfp pilus assembly protein PilW